MSGIFGFDLTKLSINNENHPPDHNGRQNTLALIHVHPSEGKQDKATSQFLANCEQTRQSAVARSKEVQKDAVNTLLNRADKILTKTENIETQIKDIREVLAELLEASKNSNQQKNAKLHAANTRLTKLLREAEKKLAARDKKDAEKKRAASRKTMSGAQLKKHSTKASSLQQSQEEIAEEEHLGRQQAVSNGTIKAAPAFGPGRRFKDGKLKKKSPFKIA